MAYTKTLIGNVTKGANHKRGDKRLQAIVDTVDENFTNIETAFGLDTVLGFGTEPGAVSSSTSGQAGTAATASRSDHNHDLGAHAHAGAASGGTIAYSDITGKPSTFAPTIGSGAGDAVAGNDARLTDARTPTSHGHTASAGDGGVLTGYQADLTASSTLADMGLAAIEPAFTGRLSGITAASTLAQLLAAIDSHTHA